MNAMRFPAATPLGFIAAVVGLLLATSPRADLPPTATDDTWIEVRTPRFHVFSNAGPVIATHAARHLERLADAMALTTGGLRVDGGRDVRIYVFRDLGSFRPYRAATDDEYTVSVGYHVAGRDAEYIAYFMAADDMPRRFAAHEYTHAVLSRSLGSIPLWANEGLAEYFSTFVAKAQSAQIGRPIPEHAAWLREHMLPLSYLLLIGPNDPSYSQGPNRPTLYAESWALVHMLILDPAGRGARFDALMEELARGTPGNLAVARVYGAGAADSLEQQLRSYAARRDLAYVEYSFNIPFESVPAEARPLDRVETRTVLGDLLAHAEDKLHPAAREHLEAAWNEDSTRALSAALLADLAERQGDRAGAESWYAVVERCTGPQSRALALAGCALVERDLARTEAPRWPAPGASGDALRGRALLERALEIEPECSEWLAHLGMTYLDDTDGWDRGMGPLMQAQGEWPRRSDIVGALSVLNVRAGNHGAAVAQYKRIPPGPDRAPWRARAACLIRRDTRDKVTVLTKAGQFAAAESLVVQLRKDVSEPGTTKYCDDLIDFIAGRAKHSESEE